MNFKEVDGKLFKTALSYNGENKKTLTDVEYLIKIGGDVNVKDEDGMPLIVRLMASDRYDDVSDILLKNEVDVNEVDVRSWRTALMVASKYGSKEMVEKLLARGARVNAIDRSGWSALYFASYYGRDDVVEVLLKNKADVNQQSYGNECASSLMACCWGWKNNENYKRCIKLLLSNGANLNIKNRNGVSVFDFAREAGNKELLAILREHKNGQAVGMARFFNKIFER